MSRFSWTGWLGATLLLSACAENKQEPALQTQEPATASSGSSHGSTSGSGAYAEPSWGTTSSGDGYAYDAGAGSASAADEPLQPAGGRASATGRTYVVRKGDTLSSIARKMYNGDQSRWKAIYEANRAQLKNPNQLAVGQKLTIP